MPCSLPLSLSACLSAGQQEGELKGEPKQGAWLTIPKVPTSVPTSSPMARRRPEVAQEGPAQTRTISH